MFLVYDVSLQLVLFPILFNNSKKKRNIFASLMQLLLSASISLYSFSFSFESFVCPENREFLFFVERIMKHEKMWKKSVFFRWVVKRSTCSLEKFQFLPLLQKKRQLIDRENFSMKKEEADWSYALKLLPSFLFAFRETKCRWCWCSASFIVCVCEFEVFWRKNCWNHRNFHINLIYSSCRGKVKSVF